MSQKRRQWDSQQKAKIVLEVLRGRSLAEVCNEYQVSQSQYYKWRDQFFENAGRAFEANQQSRLEERLRLENQWLKGLVGELTMELKKSDW